MLLAAVVAVCVASHVLTSAATVPHPEKIYYDLEDAENLFKEHIIKYERKYNIEEYNERLVIYKESLKAVNELNTLHPETVFSANLFADLTPEERAGYFGVLPPTSNNRSLTPIFPAGFEAPDQLDYRDRGIIAPIKSQLRCGSCGIFSAIANVEAQHAMKAGQCIALSEQQVMDCYSVFTCDRGAWPHEVWSFLAQDPNGSDRQDQYPYQGTVQTCHQAKGVVTVTGGRELRISDEETLKSSLTQYGPLSVTLQSDPLAYYTQGIFNPVADEAKWPDHAVLLVGYGQDQAGTKFWIIRNSWGSEWGEQGYMHLIRGVKSLKMGLEYAAISSVA